jgi:hypothetical protein
MSSRVKIEEVPEIRRIAAEQRIRYFVAASNVGPRFAFISDLGQPLVFSLDTRSAIPHGQAPKSKSFGTASCIDISDDGTYVVTGHDDGSVVIWEIGSTSGRVQSHQKLHTSPVTHVTFNETSNSFYIGDSTGLVTFVTFTRGLLSISFTEKLIFEGQLPVQSLIVSRSHGPFPLGLIAYPTKYVVFDPTLIQTGFFKGSKSECIAFHSAEFHDPPCIDLIPRHADYFLAVASGARSSLIQIRAPASQIDLLDHDTGDLGLVRTAKLLSPSLIFLVGANGTVQLLSTAGDVIARDASSSDTISQVRTILTHAEQIFIVTGNSLQTISFTAWHEIISSVAAAGDWHNAFRLLTEVRLGFNVDLIGVPSNPSARKRAVEALGQKIFADYCTAILANPESDRRKAVADCAMMALTFSTGNFVTDKIYPLFEGAKALDALFGGLFEGSTPAQMAALCTASFIGKYIQFAGAARDRQAIEEKLSRLTYSEGDIPQILEIAVANDFLQLAKHILLDLLAKPVVACELFLARDRLWDLVGPIFEDEDLQKFRRPIAVWLLCPQDGNFSRLARIFANPEKTLALLQTMVALLPIKVSFTTSLRIEHVFDAVLRVLAASPYERVAPFLDFFFDPNRMRRVAFSGASLRHIVQWLFTSSAAPSVREPILNSLIEKYPKVLPESQFAQWCESAGFIGALERFYLPQKQYSRIVASRLLSAEGQEGVFDFLENHIEDAQEVKVAFLGHIVALLLINPARTFQFVNRHYPQELGSVLELLKPQLQLVFLKHWLDNQGGLEPHHLQLHFNLMLLYDPLNASHFLSEHISNLDISKAEVECEKTGRIDCLIAIKMYNQQNREAVDQIGREIERTLLDFIQSDFSEMPATIDQLSDMVALREPMETIRIAIKLLESTKKHSDNAMQWQRVYMFFQFPMYLAGKKPANIKRAVTLMFALFVVTSLNTMEAYHAFLILSIHFSATEKDQFHEILANIFSRLDYERNLYGTVESMLTHDCVELAERAFLKETRGFQSEAAPKCAVCQQPFSRMSDPFLIFPCGHCVHKGGQCGGSDHCPQCAGNPQSAKVDLSAGEQKLTTRRVQQMMRKMEFALRSNLGEAVDTSAGDAKVFFAEPEEVTPPARIVLGAMKPPSQEPFDIRI